MYNRSDGFDTFAHTSGLERDFIERELSAVYQNKLNKGDLGAVRRGELPCVYSQCALRSGRTAQSCTTYLPLDYTGERSSYLTHTLILEDDERRRLFFDKDAFIFNSEMFVKDISSFNITSPTASPDSNYPALEYVSCGGSAEDIVKKYSEETLKAFIFATLSVLKGKGKNVYFRLPYPDAALSDAALDFVNRIAAVIPYDMRQDLSFVTYVTDLSQYPNCKLKCISDACGEATGSRNVYIDLQTNMVSGISEDEISSNRTLVNFFYMLLESKEIRDEFLAYMENAASVMPALASPTLKVLSELVFLFCAVCGSFAEDAILPNDARVYEFFCIYEKYREVLSEEYRRTAYKCLERYPRAHEAIPKNIFAKLTKLYSAECRSAKRVAMNSVLELIHTDIMREKLFVFIRANYASEDEDIKAVVNADLCRVFYGGFLQPQILEFFSANFEGAPDETKDMILDKVLLTIRTTSVQNKIIDFLYKHYNNMNETERARIYDTFFEMLPECDALSVSLCALVDAHIETEGDALRQIVNSRIAAALEADYRKKEHLLMPVLASGKGYCRDRVIGLALGEWSARKIYSEYIEHLEAKKIVEKTEEVAYILSAEHFDNAICEKLIGILPSVYSTNVEKVSLYGWLDADGVFAQKLGDEYLGAVREKIIYPAVKGRLFDVFKTEYGKEGMQRVKEYCKESRALVDTDGYRAICTFEKLVGAIEAKTADKAIELVCDMERLGASAKAVAAYLRAFVYDGSSSDAEKNMLCELSARFISNDLALDEVYSAYKQIYTQQYLIDHGSKADPRKADTEGAGRSIGLLWKHLVAIAAQSKEASDRLSAATTSLESAISRFIGDYGKGAERFIEQNMQNRPECFASCFANASAKAKAQSGGFFAKLFGKK